jgi:nitrite reductase (cytochrome c-552)
MKSRSRPNARSQRGVSTTILLASVVVAAVAAAALSALLVNIYERKQEAKAATTTRLVEVTRDTTDPAQWGANWPKQYGSYLLTAQSTRTRFGGHGGSEALPQQKIDKDPWLKRMFLGYAFSIDYRDRRGHAYMLQDQEQTQRQTKPQSGSCLHCHGAVMPLYREMGGGDAMKGFEESYKLSYKEINKKLHDMGHGHTVTCPDCHDPKTMQLIVTRPGFLKGIERLANSDAPTPFAPSIERWRTGGKAKAYDPNTDASRGEMRAFVCAQCHVEYYCSTEMPLTFPWGKGTTVQQIESFWDATKFANGSRFFDYKHAETGAPILKAQHPEFEMWSQGVHARAGVACADCHMPYARDGATKVSDHWVRSPLLNINRACQPCHKQAEDEIKARVDLIQTRNFELLQRGGVAITALMDAVLAARKDGATPEQLNPALELQRKAQWRLDFVAAENSMGFHAPQEAAKTLGEAIDYARQGEVAALRFRAPQAKAAAGAASAATPAPAASGKPTPVATTGGTGATAR